LRDAFHTEAGIEIGEWTTEWARRLYATQGRGPRMPTSSALMGMLLALVALGFALATVQQRQVA